MFTLVYFNFLREIQVTHGTSFLIAKHWSAVKLGILSTPLFFVLFVTRMYEYIIAYVTTL